ncbi:hypothetical protein [Streptomyces glycanivorans]|uniref:Uncharacterized protein n=1 Tax=Streptomyces glycanivorans TaxID=3033808 RepID=A0ABY9JRM0_9ACTN|nr:hypothetical protein [Streptomyces sp. Alt3]WLQ69414.1 hypothetical protein P8A20_38045 [Streptomyces sp. Alt3]
MTSQQLRALARGWLTNLAYQHPELAGVLLRREHGESWGGLIPFTASDLPHGGFCGWGTFDMHVCGRVLPAKKPAQ